MVIDALSRVFMGSVSHLEDDEKGVLQKVHRLARMEIKLNELANSGVMVLHHFEYSLIEEVKPKKDLDPTLVELKPLVQEGKIEVFTQERDSIL